MGRSKSCRPTFQANTKGEVGDAVSFCVLECFLKVSSKFSAVSSHKQVQSFRHFGMFLFSVLHTQ